MSTPIIAVIGRTVSEAQAYGDRIFKVPFVPFAEHQYKKLDRYQVENFMCTQTIGELPAAMISTLAANLHDVDQERKRHGD